MPAVSKSHFNLKDLTGQVFGRLTVLRDSGQRLPSRDVLWLCLCTCGSKKLATGTHLKSGRTKSCGCLRLEKHSVERKFKSVNARKRVGAAISKGYRSYVTAAQARGIEFALTQEEFLGLVHQDCYYCGSPPSMVKRAVFERCVVNGVDRVENDKGYTKDNCVPCCTKCNLMKHKFSVQEFLDHVARIYAFNQLWEVKEVA